MDATKQISKNLGGNRLGSGDKNNISLHAYNRSSHDLSRAWRSTMNVGTLVPFFKEPALNGETWSIDLEALVRTIPTTGPIYGSYKLQMDMFVCPIRLYNGLLHNNMTKIGMKMAQVKLPHMTLTSKISNPFKVDFDHNNAQISSSALIKYLGLSGIGDILNNDATANPEPEVTRKFQCVPELAYYDIYKNYYANKQEEKGVIVANGGYNRVQALSHMQGANIIFGNYQESAFGVPSTPPVTIVPSGNTYQQLETPIELRQYDQYILPIPDNFDTGSLKIIIQTIDTTTAVTTISFNEYTIGSLFSSITYVNTQGNNHQYILNTPTTYSETDKQRFIYAADYNGIVRHVDGIKLEVFDLENIDNARIAILRDTGLNNEFSMNSLNYLPYNAVWGRDNDGYSLAKNSQQGLAIKTYQSDLLQNWLQTEWIDGTNGINEITAIDVSSGSFTIDALNLANKVYNMLNRIAVSGGTYEDWQEAVYSTEAVRRAEQPIYVGGMSCEIVFEEVVATTRTEDQALGQLGGKGTITNKRGGQLEIRIDEPSYIIGICSITPRIDYSQGNDWDRTEVDTMDDWHKPALDGIGFEDLLQERAAWWGTYWDTDLKEWVKMAAGKTPAWINYMTSVNKTFGDFTEVDKNMYMTLNRQYEWDKNSVLNTNRVLGIYDLTTYIDPTKYNYGFADHNLEAQNFWVQIGARVESRRVMSAKQIPNL